VKAIEDERYTSVVDGDEAAVEIKMSVLAEGEVQGQ
jgi:hypothetical protein